MFPEQADSLEFTVHHPDGSGRKIRTGKDRYGITVIVYGLTTDGKWTRLFSNPPLYDYLQNYCKFPPDVIEKLRSIGYDG